MRRGLGDPDAARPPVTAAQRLHPARGCVRHDRTPRTVGNGTAASCTEAALRAAVSANSVVKFNCGACAGDDRDRSTIEVPTERDTVHRRRQPGHARRRRQRPHPEHGAEQLPHQHARPDAAAHRAGQRQGAGRRLRGAEPANASCAYGYASGGGAAIQVRDARLHVDRRRLQRNAAATPGPDVGGGAIYALRLARRADRRLDLRRQLRRERRRGRHAAEQPARLQQRVHRQRAQRRRAELRVGGAASCPAVGRPGQGGAGGNGGAISIDGSRRHRRIVCGSTFTGNTAGELAGALFRTADIVPRRPPSTARDSRATAPGKAAHCSS